MSTKGNDQSTTAASRARRGISRRDLLIGAGVGAAAIGLPGLFGGGRQAMAATNAGYDLAAARKEGPVVIWHADQEADVVEFLKVFTKKTGIQTVQQRLLPGAALPKLLTELRMGATDVDVYDTSDAGLMEQLRKQGHLLRYESPELAAYAPQYKSNPVGFWAAYYINIGTIMYDPRYVQPDTAPKTWLDLLDPRWKGQVGFQNASAGTQYTWWYLLKDILPKDYWDHLAAQKPRAYSSSTQIVTDMHNGNLKIGGKVSSFQYVKSKRLKQPIEIVFPPEGAPAQSQVVGIIGPTKRPNAAKAYVNFLLSQEGQQSWNQIQGSPSARTDVDYPGQPDMSKAKIIVPTDMDDYALTTNHAEFVKLWNKITGF
ncbi:MAG: extracellular solute-binding protein [Burkholderiaceae bacterium]